MRENRPSGIVSIEIASTDHSFLSDLVTSSYRNIDEFKNQLSIVPKENYRELWNTSQEFLVDVINALGELNRSELHYLRVGSHYLDNEGQLNAICIDFSNDHDRKRYADISNFNQILKQGSSNEPFSEDNLHEWIFDETMTHPKDELDSFITEIRPSPSLKSWCSLVSKQTDNPIHEWLETIAHAAISLQRKSIIRGENHSIEFLQKHDYVTFDTENPWISPKNNVRSASCFLVQEAEQLFLRLKETECIELPIQRQSTVELFVFSADSPAELTNQLIETKSLLTDISTEDFLRMAARLSQKASKEFRSAIVAKNPDDLSKRIDQVVKGISKRDKPSARFRPGISWNTSGKFGAKLAGVLPGQGSQQLNMLKSLCLRFPSVRSWFDDMESALVDLNDVFPSLTLFPPAQGLDEERRNRLTDNLHSQEGGNPAVIVSSLAINELLNSFSCFPDVLVGHSSGEISALLISESIKFENREDLFETITAVNRKGLEGNLRGEIPTGKFLAVTASDESILDAFLQKHEKSVYLAMDNCPQQKVLFFEEAGFEDRKSELVELGVICFPLYFDRAYHTELFEVEMDSIREVYNSFDLSAPKVPIFSCIELKDFPNEADAIRKTAGLNWTNCVRFKEACEILYDDGVHLFLEIGPSGVLSGFIDNTLQDRPHKALPLDQSSTDSFTSLLNVLATLFTEGINLDLSELYAHIDTTTEEKTVFPPSNESENLQEPNYQKLAPIPVSQNQQTRAQILSQHFAFMNEYLATQTRMLNAVQSAQVQKVSQPVPRIATQAPTPTPVHELNLSDLPLIDTVLSHSSESCIAQRVIKRSEDLFLQHHTLGRFILEDPNDAAPLPIVPLAMNIEMMAEAASLLAPQHFCVTEILHLSALRWMTVDEDELILELQSSIVSQENSNETHVLVSVTQQGEPNLPYVQCTIVLREEYQPKPTAKEFDAQAHDTALWNAESFFEHCLFHGESFSSMNELLRLGENTIEVGLTIPKTDQLFQHQSQPTFKTPGQVLDVPGHAVAWWKVEHGDELFGIFPISIDRLSFYDRPMESLSNAIGRGQNKSIDNLLETEFEILNLDGSVHTVISGFKFIYYRFETTFLRSHYWTGPNAYYSESIVIEDPEIIGCATESLKDNFLHQSGGLWMKSLAHMFCNTKEKAQWDNLPVKGPRREEWLLGRIAAKEIVRRWAFELHSVYITCPDIEISVDENGRPFAICPELEAYGQVPNISITHSGSRAIAIAAKKECRVGVDLEYFPQDASRNTVEGSQPLAIAFSEKDLQLFKARGNANLYELVCAKEAASKAVGTGFLGTMKSWEISDFSDKTVQVEIFNHTITVSLVRSSDSILAFCKMPRENAVEITNHITEKESINI